MSTAPRFEIDPDAFWADPYESLARMRRTMPIAYVPQLGATLITKRDDIFDNEKKIDVFSSDQPEGLMITLMGQNLMRKDGEAHLAERQAIFPSVSPKTVKNVWKTKFEQTTDRILTDLASNKNCDLVADFAMPVSAEALKEITGLTNMHYAEMNRVSQGMIDGCANYSGDADVESHCDDCTTSIDRHIDEMLPVMAAEPNASLLSVQIRAGLSDAQIRANIKLAISGGQNEPRDAIAGAAWALLSHPEQLRLVLDGEVSWLKVFEEYARWISPIGMSPRRVARRHEVAGVIFEPDDRVFLMFSSGNRDEDVFERPEIFNVSRDASKSISFGAGPHYCAGAWASRCLIADVALPKLFASLAGLRLVDATKVAFRGWAFRGPRTVPCAWQQSAFARCTRYCRRNQELAVSSSVKGVPGRLHPHDNDAVLVWIKNGKVLVPSRVEADFEIKLNATLLGICMNFIKLMRGDFESAITGCLLHFDVSPKMEECRFTAEDSIKCRVVGLIMLIDVNRLEVEQFAIPDH